MALQCLVKISSVNNLSDARYAAGMGVDLMGFVVDPDSEGFVSPEQFQGITGWLSGVKFVGEVDNMSHDSALQALSKYQLDYIQVNASFDLRDPQEFTLPLIVKLDQPDHIHISAAFDKYSTIPEWYLLEPEQSMSQEVLDWCAQQAEHYPIILGSNISPDNVHQLLQQGFRGISLRGGREIRPGYKSFDELADVLEALEID